MAHWQHLLATGQNGYFCCHEQQQLLLLWPSSASCQLPGRVLLQAVALWCQHTSMFLLCVILLLHHTARGMVTGLMCDT